MMTILTNVTIIRVFLVSMVKLFMLMIWFIDDDFDCGSNDYVSP